MHTKQRKENKRYIFSNFLVLKRNFFFIVMILLSLLLLAAFIKGRPQGSSLYYQKQYDTALGGPFEQSISAGRYALTASIVLDHSLLLTKKLAKFSSPDIVLYKGKFISVFTPGISFLGIPFYLIGQLIMAPQLFTYLPIIVLTIVNAGLIIFLSKRLGTPYSIGIFTGFIYIFATNALPYAFTFTQHAANTLLILLALINATLQRTWKNNILFGVICGVSPLVDIPNIFLIAPIGIYIILKHFYQTLHKRKASLSIRLNMLGILIGFLPFITLFAWYNYTTTGSPVKIAQLIGNTDYFNATTRNMSIPKKNTVKIENGTLPAIGMDIPFKTRNLLNGLYILLVSRQRSWVYYCPIVLLGIFGIWKSRKSKAHILVKLSVAVILVNILLYAMFGDPWGGWNFGPRYLIPSAAILCVFIGPVITRYKKNILFILLLFILLIYSTWVNEMGSLTTISIPPKVEALALKNPIPYTYAYNQQLLQKNFSSSLMYNLFLKNLFSPIIFLYILIVMTMLIFISIYLVILTTKNSNMYE